MANRIWIDPPSGWRWGFPKVFDPEKDGDLMEWIVAQGYPQSEIDALGDSFHWHCWAHEDNEIEFKRGLQVKPGAGSET